MSDTPSPIEEGRSPVAGAGRHELSIGTKLGIMGLIGVLALAFVWFSALYGHKAPKPKETAAAAYSNGGQQYTPPPPAAAKATPAALPQPAAVPGRSSLFGLASRGTPATAPIMAFSSQARPPASTPAPAGIPAGDTAGALPPPISDNSPLAAKLRPTMLSGEKAAVLKHPNLTITEGTLIPCILQTAINSELPGLTTCVVPIDIRGTTGNVVLLDRGTKIVGQIESGLLQGRNRVFVDWTRAETPDHVLITLDSPGSDELGRAGLPGAVNTHFWDRFGGALMLTLVQGGLDAATIAAAGQNNTNSTAQQAGLGFVYAAQSNGQSVANTALENSINVPPTLTKNQGDTVSLIVAHDLDFSDVYKLEVSAADATYGR